MVGENQSLFIRNIFILYQTASFEMSKWERIAEYKTRCVRETPMPPKHPSFEKHDPDI